MQRRVLVFGTFDGLHEGHLFFLQKAKSFGDYLIVSVARDQHIRELKKKDPLRGEQERLTSVRALDFVDEAHLSDPVLGSFEIIDRVHPDCIVLGYDQRELEKALSTNIPLLYAPHLGRD